LRSCRDADNKILWYVENSEEFEELPYGVYYEITAAVDESTNQLAQAPNKSYYRYGYQKFDYGYVKRTFASKKLIELKNKLSPTTNDYDCYFDIDIYSA
jgi:hypothetical protein